MTQTPQPGRGPAPAPPIRLILWGSILLSAVTIGAVGTVIGPRTEPAVGAAIWILAAIVLAGLAWWFASRSGESGSAPPSPTAVSPVSAREVVVWTLDEAVAVLGCVSRITGSSENLLIVFCAASVVLLVLHRPR